MDAMTLRDRIGVDLGGRRRLEDGLAWAAAHDVHYVDMCLEGAPDHPNAPSAWTVERVAAMRAACERYDIHVGLHSASAVNVAETSPLLAAAADQYLRAYVDLAGRLGAEWIVVHGGYHFTGDFAARLAASVDRLKRAAAYAEARGARLLLENLNREPEHAEIRYLAHNLEECREYFGRIRSPALGWAFTVNHAHLVPEGIDGFLDVMDLGRCGEVRLADSHGRHEQHLRPGEGTIDFARMFARIEGGGYRGHYMMAFGSLDDMLEGRERLVGAPGVEV